MRASVIPYQGSLGPGKVSGPMVPQGLVVPRAWIRVQPQGAMALPWKLELQVAGGQAVTIASSTATLLVAERFPLPRQGFGSPTLPALTLSNGDAAQIVDFTVILFEDASITVLDTL